MCARLCSNDKEVQQNGQNSELSLRQIWGVKFPKDFHKIQREGPEGMYFFNGLTCIKTYISFILGLLPFLPIRENSIQFPLINDAYVKCEIQRASTFKMKAVIWLMSKIIGNCNFLSRFVFPHLQKRGIICIYWVLNEETCLNYALKVISPFELAKCEWDNDRLPFFPS